MLKVIRNALKSVKELDLAITELRQATEQSRPKYEELFSRIQQYTPTKACSTSDVLAGFSSYLMTHDCGDKTLSQLFDEYTK